MFFIAFFSLIFKWIKIDFNFKELLFIIVFSVGITLVFKFPFSHHFFGLEYEDSYIFNFSARQLYKGIYPVSFLTDGISIGSLTNPYMTTTYGGHFIAYPVFLSWFYHIFGYNIYIPSFLNTFIEFLTVFSLSISFKKVFGIQQFWFVPGLIYSIAPAMNLFGTTHLSETFSSFIILMCILSFYYFFQTNKIRNLIILGICFLTALITKRENTVLISLALIFPIYQLLAGNKIRFTNLLPIILSISLLIIYLLFIQNIFSIEKTESSEISAKTFSLSNFLNLGPVFITALLNFKWFNIYFFILISAIIYILFERDIRPFQLSVMVLYFSYFLIYTFHYRSYYFIHFNNVTPFEALRYLNNFFVISTLIISYCVCKLLVNHFFKKIFTVMILFLLFISIINTHLLRKEYNSYELENRFSNPKLVLEYLSNKERTVLITDNILIFQLLGNDNLELVDLYFWGEYKDKFNPEHAYLFITNFNMSKEFEYRYPNICALINRSEKSEIMKFGNGDSLYLIE